MADKLLIVDDDARLLKLLQEYLEAYGFQIPTLTDGASVVKTVQTEAPDLVILDILLPDMHGLDVLKDIRTASAVPVIMLTSRGDEADRISFWRVCLRTVWYAAGSSRFGASVGRGPGV